MKYGITKRQSEFLEYLKSVTGQPSYREIAEGFKVKSVSEVHRLMMALVERGHIEYLPNRARSWRLK